MVLVRLFALVLLLGMMATGATAATTIPLVGCPGDDGFGLVKPIAGRPVTVEFTKSLARQLAYYSGPDGPDLIGPAGWHCFWNSSGGYHSLIIAPTERDAAASDGFSAEAKSPIIFYETWQGDTQGVDVIDSIAARFFLSALAHPPKGMLDDPNISNMTPIPVYPQDRYSPLPTHFDSTTSREYFVKFSTPAEHDGFGTWLNELDPSDLPIDGIAFYAQSTYAPAGGTLRVRLPATMATIKAVIISNFPAQLVSFWDAPE